MMLSALVAATSMVPKLKVDLVLSSTPFFAMLTENESAACAGSPEIVALPAKATNTNAQRRKESDLSTTLARPCRVFNDSFAFVLLD
jgi:hypothetical protein